MNTKVIALVVSCLLLALFACSKKADAPAEEDEVYVDPELVAIVRTNPQGSPAPEPSTPEKIELGKLLFSDKRISKGGDVSCASCHDLANHGMDGKPTATGTGGAQTTRNAPSVLNAGKQLLFFWDGRATKLEDVPAQHVKDASTHGIADDAELVAKIKAAPELGEAFAKAFPGGGDTITAARFGIALGAYLRTLTTRTRFDEYLDGNEKALTAAEKKGLKVFISGEAGGCTVCHVTRLLGGDKMQKFGLVRTYESKDLGKYETTRQEADKGFYKVPSLVNVAKTGPWLHDASGKSLEEVVKMMRRYHFSLELSDADALSLATFLGALTAK